MSGTVPVGKARENFIYIYIIAIRIGHVARKFHAYSNNYQKQIPYNNRSANIFRLNAWENDHTTF
jgi:hypothetical protein